MENSFVVLHLLREFARAPLTFLNAFSKNFLIIYVIMSENEWIEKQKQRLSQNVLFRASLTVGCAHWGEG